MIQWQELDVVIVQNKYYKYEDYLVIFIIPELGKFVRIRSIVENNILEMLNREFIEAKLWNLYQKLQELNALLVGRSAGRYILYQSLPPMKEEVSYFQIYFVCSRIDKQARFDNLDSDFFVVFSWDR